MASAAESRALRNAVEALFNVVAESADEVSKLLRGAGSVSGPPDDVSAFLARIREDVLSVATQIRRASLSKRIVISQRPETEFGVVVTAALMLTQPAVYERCISARPKQPRKSSRILHLVGIAAVDLQEVARYVGRMRASKLDVVKNIDNLAQSPTAAAAGATSRGSGGQSPPQDDTPAAPDSDPMDAVLKEAAQNAEAGAQQRRTRRAAAERSPDQPQHPPNALALELLAPVLQQQPITVTETAESRTAPDSAAPVVDDGPNERFPGEGTFFALPLASIDGAEELSKSHGDTSPAGHNEDGDAVPAAKRHQSEADRSSPPNDMDDSPAEEGVNGSAGEQPKPHPPRVHATCAVCGLVTAQSAAHNDAQPQRVLTKRGIQRRRKAIELLAQRDVTRRDELYKCSDCGVAYHRSCIYPPRFEIHDPFVCTPCLSVAVHESPVLACDPVWL